MPKTRDDRINAAAQRLLGEGLQTDGVASVQVANGQLFAFSADKLKDLLEAAQRGDGQVLVFVKSGPSVDAVEVNN